MRKVLGACLMATQLKGMQTRIPTPKESDQIRSGSLGADLSEFGLLDGFLLPVLCQLQRSLPVLQRLPHETTFFRVYGHAQSCMGLDSAHACCR